MSGVGSTNAMKKGSANNPFLAYSEADMAGFLNSAYTGCIVKYTGPAINRALSEQNKTVPEYAQNLVFNRDNYGWPPFYNGNIKFIITEKTNEGTNTWYLAAGKYANGAWDFSRNGAVNGDVVLTNSLEANPTSVRKLWTPDGGWNNDYINEQGNLTFWTYDEDVLFTIAQIDTNVVIDYTDLTGITIVPYKVNELYKVVYGDGEYYYEEFYHISDTRTTANSDYIAPGKTAFDFTGNLQTGNGSKINPYLAYTVAELQSYPVGSFIKWLGPNKTVLDSTTGQVLIQGEVYRAVEDGDILQYVILPTLSNPGTAADLAQGKQLIDGDGKIVEGEAVFSFGDYFVKVMDYDGTILMEKKGNTGDIIDLPVAPVHDKLVFQEWSASVIVSNNKVTIANNDIIVGAVYTTASGQNEFDITLTKVTGLSVTINMDGTKDWGDGISDTETTHTYAAYGDYTIKCNGTIMTTSSSSGLFGQSGSKNNYYCKKARIVTNIGEWALRNCYSLTEVIISNHVKNILKYSFAYDSSLTTIVIPTSVISLQPGVFQYCYSLVNIVIPTSATSIGNGVFYSCYSLTSVIIPDGAFSIDASVFQNCYSLVNVVIPDSVTSIGPYAFMNCYSLISITIPIGVTIISGFIFNGCFSLTNITLSNSITSIEGGALEKCFSLTNIVMPASINNIASNAFTNCFSLLKYDFSSHTSVPSIAGTNVFDNINAITKIIVPDNLYDAWIADPIWSSYANYIYKASEEVTQ